MHLRRRLAAILLADVAGYARLMSLDEHGTVDALQTVHAICRKHIAPNQGRVVDMAGDSILAVFETAIGAVTAALGIQRGLGTAFPVATAERLMRIRIGLHLGDVVENADGTVYGDGVNIAARLQAAAEPGGIIVSDAIQGAVRGKVAADFVDARDLQIKNIAYPVRAYQMKAENQLSTYSPSATETTVAAESRQARSGRAMKILFVDDHALFREGVAELLRGLDPEIEILHAANAEVALAQAAAGTDFDFVLLDLRMPGMSGLDLLQSLRKELPTVPVIVLSADESRVSVMAAIDKGAMGYIPKSCPWAVMKQALGLVLAGGIYLPPAVLAFREVPASKSGELSLTPRQMDVLRCLLRGMPNKIICRELGISEGTIKSHIAAVFSSLQVHNRSEAVVEASRRGLHVGV
ncbi:MAG: response regulator [Rhodoglobus sp.]